MAEPFEYVDSNIAIAIELLSKAVRVGTDGEQPDTGVYVTEGLDTLALALTKSYPDGTQSESLDIAKLGVGATPDVAAALLACLDTLTATLSAMLGTGTAKLAPADAADWATWRERLALYHETLASVEKPREPNVTVWQQITLPLLQGYYWAEMPGVSFPVGYTVPVKKTPDARMPFSIYANAIWYEANVSRAQELGAEWDTALTQLKLRAYSAVRDIGKALSAGWATALKIIGVIAAGYVAYRILRKGGNSAIANDQWVIEDASTGEVVAYSDQAALAQRGDALAAEFDSAMEALG